MLTVTSTINLVRP